MEQLALHMAAKVRHLSGMKTLSLEPVCSLRVKIGSPHLPKKKLDRYRNSLELQFLIR